MSVGGVFIIQVSWAYSRLPKGEMSQSQRSQLFEGQKWLKFPEPAFFPYCCARQNLNGSRCLTTPLSGMPYHPRLAISTDNLPTKFEVSISTQYEDIKDDTKWRKWGGLGVVSITQGQWKQHQSIQHIRVPISIPCPYFAPLVRYSQILVKIAVLTYPTYIWRHRRGDSVGISPRSLASEARRIALSCGIKISPVGSLDQSKSTRVTDRQTDRRTELRRSRLLQHSCVAR